MAQSEESSVALYSLGNPELLAAATDEVIGVLTIGECWDLVVTPGDRMRHRALDVPCSRLRSVFGNGRLFGMVSAANRRLAGLLNASVRLTTGQDLAEFGSGSMDLVYSVVPFPTSCCPGRCWFERHFREVRACSARRRLVLFNYAYGRSAKTATARCSRMRTARDCSRARGRISVPRLERHRLAAEATIG